MCRQWLWLLIWRRSLRRSFSALAINKGSSIGAVMIVLRFRLREESHAVEMMCSLPAIRALLDSTPTLGGGAIVSNGCKLRWGDIRLYDRAVVDV